MDYKISQYARKYNVTVRTVWNWIYKNKVATKKTETGGWLISEPEDCKPEIIYIYARVSSSENKNNLESQKQRILDYCAAKGYRVSGIVTEIGSGLNDNRQKLEKILLDKSITKIVVEHKDRLARFGLNYIEKLLRLDNRQIEYINPILNERDDLMGDFVSIITSFCARLYGKRRNKKRVEQIVKEVVE